MTYSEDTLVKVREAVAAVVRRDINDCTPECELSLDSISRITLIAELENMFSAEFFLEDLDPEVFASLASIASFVEGLRR